MSGLTELQMDQVGLIGKPGRLGVHAIVFRRGGVDARGDSGHVDLQAAAIPLTGRWRVTAKNVMHSAMPMNVLMIIGSDMS